MEAAELLLRNSNSQNFRMSRASDSRHSRTSKSSSLKKKQPEGRESHGAPSNPTGSAGGDKRVSFSQTIQERGDTITVQHPRPVSVFSRNVETYAGQEPRTTREISLREFFEFDWKRNREANREEARKKRLEKGFEDYATLLYKSKHVETQGHKFKIYVSKKQCIFDSNCHAIGLEDLPILEGRPKTDLERLDVFFLILKTLENHFVEKHQNPSEFEKEALTKIIAKLYDVIVERIGLRGYKTREDEEEEARLQKISRRTQGYSDIIRSRTTRGGTA